MLTNNLWLHAGLVGIPDFDGVVSVSDENPGRTLGQLLLSRLAAEHAVRSLCGLRWLRLEEADS